MASGKPEAGLLLEASPVPAEELCSQGGYATSLVSGSKAAELSRVRVVPEPLASLGRRSKGRLEACGFLAL